MVWAAESRIGSTERYASASACGSIPSPLRSSSASSVPNNPACRCHGYIPRSHCSRYMANAQPSPSLPIRRSPPTRTPSKSTSPSSSRPDIVRISRTSTPGVSWSTSIIESPRCHDSGVPVRRSTTQRDETVACDVQTLCPSTIQSSPSRTAFVRSEARSLPASGSEKPWHQRSAPRRRSVRWARRARARARSTSGSASRR